MPTAFLLCGPSLSGKSTFARQIVDGFDASVCSADEINARRGLPFGAEGLPESVWAETLRLQLQDIAAAGTAGRSIVVDDTLCYRWLRDRMRAAAHGAGLETRLLTFAVADDVLFARHAGLLRSAARPVLSRQRLAEHLAAFEWPAADESPVDVASDAAQRAWLDAERGREAA